MAASGGKRSGSPARAEDDAKLRQLANQVSTFYLIVPYPLITPTFTHKL